MLLTIIVPVYNVHDYLNRCIDSLLKTNDKQDYDIILVDDGSKDDSGDICDQYSQKYSYIKTIHQLNGGLSHARNEGLKIADGDYILFIDSDDYVEKDSICSILREIETQECDIYCCDFYKIYQNKRIEIKYTHTDNIQSGYEFMKFQLQNHTMIPTVIQNIYRRKLLIDNDLFFKKGILHEDEQWYPRVFIKASSVKHLNIVYYAYMIREDSITQQKDLTKNIKDFITTMNEILDMFVDKVDEHFYFLLKDDLVNKYLSFFAHGDFGSGTKDIVLSRKQLKKGLINRKTKIKLFLFSINRKLFCKVAKIYNNKR